MEDGTYVKPNAFPMIGKANQNKLHDFDGGEVVGALSKCLASFRSRSSVRRGTAAPFVPEPTFSEACPSKDMSPWEERPVEMRCLSFLSAGSRRLIYDDRTCYGGLINISKLFVRTKVGKDKTWKR